MIQVSFAEFQESFRQDLMSEMSEAKFEPGNMIFRVLAV